MSRRVNAYSRTCARRRPTPSSKLILIRELAVRGPPHTAARHGAGLRDRGVGDSVAVVGGAAGPRLGVGERGAGIGAREGGEQGEGDREREGEGGGVGQGGGRRAWPYLVRLRCLGVYVCACVHHMRACTFVQVRVCVCLRAGDRSYACSLACVFAYVCVRVRARLRH
jgi:hypothetical protein